MDVNLYCLTNIHGSPEIARRCKRVKERLLMQELFGIPLALDIGTFLGLVAGGATAAGATRWLTQRWRADRLEAEAQARADKRDAEERAEAAVEQYRMHKEALEIHGSLTSLEVFQAATRAGTDSADKDFLIATYQRGRSRYNAFKEGVTVDSDLEDLVSTSLKAIADLYPSELGSQQVQVDEQRKRRRGEFSKFRVDDSGIFSKHHTLHAIQRRFCEVNGITARDEFERGFGALVEEIIGCEVGRGRFSASKLLKDPAVATAKNREKYGEQDRSLIAKLGAISLDGVDYIADYDVGFAPQPANIGRTVQLPLIKQLIIRPGYEHIIAVS